MSGGLFTVARGVFEHPAFSSESFTEREAWLWLVSEAAWAGRSVRVGKGYDFIELARGQLTHSLRFMADKWQWKKDRVSRYLKMLEKRDMVETRIETGQTVITICNYEKFQDFDVYRATEVRQEPRQKPDSDATPARQQRDKEEHLTNHITASTTRARPDLDELSNKLLEAGGDALRTVKPGMFANLSLPLAWLADGADLELDILHTVRRLCLAKPPGSVKGWSYFTEAIAEAKANRETPLPEVSPNVRPLRTGSHQSHLSGALQAAEELERSDSTRDTG